MDTGLVSPKIVGHSYVKPENTGSLLFKPHVRIYIIMNVCRYTKSRRFKNCENLF